MRAIAELPHPDFRVTIFSMNQKFIIKFEQGSLEQVYKIAEADVTGGVDGVFQLIDDEFTESVSKRFDEMRRSCVDAYKRHEF